MVIACSTLVVDLWERIHTSALLLLYSYIQNIGIMSITSNIFVRINGVFLKGIEKKSVTTLPPLILVTDGSLKVPQNKFNKKNYKRIIGV